MKRAVLLSAIIFIFNVGIFSQVAAPLASQRQSVTQTVGDATITIVYHRPNVNGRKIWGGLVPYDKVWRSGANEATTFEVSRDANINGKPLPAGKYSFHTIPTSVNWTIIFNKKADQWGSFDHDEKLDALRVSSQLEKADFRESLSYNFENITPSSAVVLLRWENIAVPFTVDVGDVHGRVLTQMREAIKNRKPEDARPLNQAANYVLTYKLKDSYTDAAGWIDASIGLGETFGNLGAKARLLNEQGKTAEAIAMAEKAIAAGKAATPPVNVNALNALQDTVNEWKAKK